MAWKLKEPNSYYTYMSGLKLSWLLTSRSANLFSNKLQDDCTIAETPITALTAANYSMFDDSNYLSYDPARFLIKPASASAMAK